MTTTTPTTTTPTTTTTTPTQTTTTPTTTTTLTTASTTTTTTTTPTTTTTTTSITTTTPTTTILTSTAPSQTTTVATTVPSAELNNVTASDVPSTQDTSKIEDVQTATDVPNSRTQPPQSGAIAYESGCGVTQGCFSSCASTSCDFLVSWKLTDTTAIYTLRATSSATSGIYMALGFSYDNKMGNDSAMGCVYDNKTFLKFTVFNVGASPQAFTDDEIQLTNASFINGVLTCQITRPIGERNQRFNITLPWHLLFAVGSGFIVDGEASILKHSKVSISEAPVSAAAYLTMTSEIQIQDTLVKAHGCLMVSAWIFLASIGTVVARFFKPVLTSTFFSQKLWFQLHRLAMLLVLLATASGFIIIFVKEKEWSDIEEEETYLEGHPIMGVIVMVLTILNPVMALFRPHLGTSKRCIFNWAHLFVGTSAHILGVVTIFFGVQLHSADTPRYTVKLLGAYVAWQLFVYLLLEVITHCKVIQPSKQEIYELYSVSSKTNKGSTQNARQMVVKNIILAVHCFVVTALSATIIAVIAVGT
uniref:Ferric-chelate reductase 1 n=1 Tax=Biomphalaria glabrata TaxID=6526 RepID=A0A2C9JHY4_BIOGL